MDAMEKKTDTFSRSFQGSEFADVSGALGSTNNSCENNNVTFAQHSGKNRFTGKKRTHANPVMGSPLSAS
jgi:hypothetical protein